MRAEIDNLVDKKIYSREPKFPPAVPRLNIELAQDCSEEDPSVQKIKEWRNPWTEETKLIGLRWTTSSQKELAVGFLTLYKTKFEQAWDLLRLRALLRMEREY